MLWQHAFALQTCPGFGGPVAETPRFLYYIYSYERATHPRIRSSEILTSPFKHSPVRPIYPLFALAVLLLCLFSSPVMAAGPDNNIEWGGISHLWWQDRRPVVPVSGETFEVRFQTYQGDLTAARVQADDGSVSWITASQTDTRGPYDIWTAQIPATAATSMSYFIELTDGTDTDYLSISGFTESPPADGGYVLDFSTFEHAPLGATLTNGTAAVFRVWAPGATTCHVRGDFNSWGLSHSLPKIGDHFLGRVTNVLPGHQYKYFFNGSTWKEDPRARGLNSGSNNNSIVINPFAYAWQIDDFQTPPLEELIIYQLHVGTFSGRNDPVGTAPHPGRYADVTARAGHLAELGINAVMLNPVTEFPFDISAGYNPITEWSPEWAYGSPDDFRAMVDALHAQGIAVLLDIVWNHFSNDGNFLWDYDGSQIYFDTPHVDTPWGAQADFDEPEVRDYFANSSLFWMEELRIDGFRMDATDFMNQGAHASSGWSLMQRFNDEMDNRWADKIAIAEQLPDDGAVTTATSSGGAGFDAQYFDAFTDRLREEMGDAAFGDPEMWKIREVINGYGASLSGERVVNYVELHDEAWPTSGGQRMVKTIDTTAPHDDQWAQGRTKLAQSIVMMAPGVPAMLMGTEWLEDTDFGTDQGNRIDWSTKTTYATIFNYYQDIITLRRENGSFFANAGHNVHHLNESGNVIGWHRWDGSGEDFVVVANFSNNDYSSYRVGLPEGGDWSEVLNSQAGEYGGSGSTNPGTLTAEGVAKDGFGQSVTINLAKMAFVILADAPNLVAVPEPEALQSGGLFLGAAVPNPTTATSAVRFRLPTRSAVHLSVHDVRGRRVRTLIDRSLSPGTHTAGWDGRDESGVLVQPGLYFLRLETPGEIRSRKLLFIP
jgi:1,4-alpha-glucan branching enzyme